jgi:hypothetical protein
MAGFDNNNEWNLETKHRNVLIDVRISMNSAEKHKAHCLVTHVHLPSYPRMPYDVLRNMWTKTGACICGMRRALQSFSVATTG